MTDPLRVLLERADELNPVFAAGELMDWPAEDRGRLERLGLLTETTPAETWACDSCGGDHIEQVVWLDAPNRPRRAFIPCPVAGRVSVPSDRLRRWAVRVPELARGVAQAIAAAGVVAERRPGRIWKLGVVRVCGQAWVAYLGVGRTQPDRLMAAQLPELRGSNALLFIPTTLASDITRSLGVEAVRIITLTDLLSLGEAGLVVDRLFLESALIPPVVSTAVSTGLAVATTWEEVTLLVEERHVRVRIGGSERRVGLAKAGFADRRKAESPNQAWALLTKLARHDGTLASPDRIAVKSDALKRGMTRLRKALRNLVDLDEDPFHPVGRGGRYRARFHIRAAAGATFPTPAGATWDHVTLTEVTAGMITVAVEAETAGAVYTCDDGGGHWEATTETGERTGRYSLAELGLTEPARSALLAVLRNAGTVRRAERDSGMLSLGKGLTRFLQINESPFAFRHGTWIAQFVADSRVPSADR